MIEPRLLRVEDAADYLAVGRNEVYRLAAKDPTFPRPFAFDPKGRAKYDRRDLDAWIDAKKAESAERDLPAAARERIEEIAAELRVDSPASGRQHRRGGKP